jgi:RNA polymerase sigma factor (sigma-70 family)
MYVITNADLLLVKRVVVKVFGITRDHCLFDDAVSIGNEALLKARNIFDTSYNTKFTTLAYGVIFNDVSDLLNSVYGKEFYLHKMALFDDEDTEDVIEYSDVDAIDILENEERIEIALGAIRDSPKEHIDIIVAYLSGVDYKETIKKLKISKDRYYRVINKVLKKVKACSQT